MGFVRPLWLIGTTFAALLGWHYSQSFVLPSTKGTRGTTKSFNHLFAEKLSYTERLRLAQEAKRKGKPANQAAPAPVRSPEQVAQAKQIAGSTDPEDSLPFSDQIYEDMSYVIGKLQNRLRNRILLTPDELSKFEAAAGRIVADGRNGGYTADNFLPEEEPEPVIQETIEGVKVQMKIDKKSQHYIDGMETMTPDEYRAAMDQKIRQMRGARRQAGYQGGGQQQKDYFDSLSSS
mmetsp:Transcript_1764/g.2385  ORF Transcript_1764/g.2385 Transcript_1764/m.2385 type:complete len:234 (-) Transcript_1764:281-982(-)|eukprot:CAMPEP_0117758752 /NCGR_PEP_ID=MMETSP0947-20121206/15594_1 /TAXON_ID=44440 /ORGANISM="Chattonella subsalsa, Strain CCMP2191" /LENGTH=233 /DNA_ID=CAMNT_0005579057 /DNA_START=68 /DNA_END=769 /DNA_ORIENTATION=+